MRDIDIDPSILTYLAPGLEANIAELSSTWKPEDPAYRADFYRQTMMNLSWAYFAFFHADAEHPDWAPLWNPVYTDQPNPDDIYVYSPIRGDLRYRISGPRGTCSLLTFNIMKGWVGITERSEMGFARDFDDRAITVDADGNVDILLSAQRPEQHSGDWFEIAPEATVVVLQTLGVDDVQVRHQIHPKLVGKIRVANPVGPGWANPENESFEDPRLRGRDGRAYGPLPRAWAHYKGLYHFGQRVIVSYTVGKAAVLESPGFELDATRPDAMIFTRTLRVGGSPHDLQAGFQRPRA